MNLLKDDPTDKFEARFFFHISTVSSHLSRLGVLTAAASRFCFARLSLYAESSACANSLSYQVKYHEHKFFIDNAYGFVSPESGDTHGPVNWDSVCVIVASLSRSVHRGPGSSVAGTVAVPVVASDVFPPIEISNMVGRKLIRKTDDQVG